MVETLQYPLTSQAEIERILSATTSLAYADDDGDTVPEPGVWDDIVSEASDTVTLYIDRFYAPEDAVNNLWVRRQASWIGAYLLTQRRGDPGLFHDRYERIVSMLERVHEGLYQIPRLPTREDLTPAHSNLIVDDRFIRRKIRVSQETSTGGTSGRQDLTPDYIAGDAW